MGDGFPKLNEVLATLCKLGLGASTGDVTGKDEGTVCRVRHFGGLITALGAQGAGPSVRALAVFEVDVV